MQATRASLIIYPLQVQIYVSEKLSALYFKSNEFKFCWDCNFIRNSAYLLLLFLGQMDHYIDWSTLNLLLSISIQQIMKIPCHFVKEWIKETAVGYFLN